MTKRILSLVMALVMVLSMVPAFAEAHEHKISYYTSKDNKTHEAYCDCGALQSTNNHTYSWDKFGVASCEVCGWKATVAGCAAIGAVCNDRGYVIVEGGHKKACSVCGLVSEANQKADPIPHTYGYTDGNMTVLAECVCGQKIDCAHSYVYMNRGDGYCLKYCELCNYRPEGNAHAHSFKYEKRATHDEDAHAAICVNCGYAVGQNHSVVRDEDNSEKWFTDTINHWQECSQCGEIIKKAEHTLRWDWIDAAKPSKGVKQYCTGCGFVVAQCEEHVATGANAPTCESNGICDNCGKEVVPATPVPHTWEANVNLGSVHGTVCAVCGAHKNDQVAHTYVLIGSEGICVCGDKLETICTTAHQWKETAAQTGACDKDLADGAMGNVVSAEKYCEVCHVYAQVKETTAIKHTWLKEISVEPSCFVKGTMKKTCSVCGRIEFVEIPTTDALAHDLVFVKVGKAATCIEAGYEVWQCTNPACPYAKGKDLYFPVVLEKLDHVTKQFKVDYENGILTDELNCEGGIYSYTGCENCSYRLSAITKIPNSEHPDHKLEYVGKVDATCTTPAGYAYVCTNNDCEYAEIQDEDGEAYPDSAYGTYHKVGGGVIEHVVPATCTEKGSKWYECPKCHEQIAPAKRVGGIGNWVDSDEVFTIAALGHTNAANDYTNDAIWKETKATCEAFGYFESNCSRCNDNYRKVVVSETFAACEPVKGKALTEEVCGKTADYEKVCKWCGKHFTNAHGEQEIYEDVAVDHDWVMDGEVITAGKYCHESDYAAAICTRCGTKDAYREFAPSAAEKEHDFVEATIPADCENPARKSVYCAKCGFHKNGVEVETEGTKLGHSWDNGELVKYCGKNNVIKSTCLVCGAEQYQEAGADEPFTPATTDGHKTTSIKPLILVEKTCESKGLQMKSYCADCGYIFDKTIEAYGTSDHTKPADFSTAKNVYTDCTGTYEKFTCTECELLIDRKLAGTAGDKKDADEHREPVYELIKPFTCTESGFGYEACTACGYKAEKPAVIEAQHVWSEDLVVVEAPTCGKDGKGKVVCTVCGQEDTYNGKVVYVTIPATKKHTFVEYVKSSGICTEKSYVIYECSVCKDAADTKTLQKAGYSYINNNQGETFKYLDPVTNTVKTAADKLYNCVETVQSKGTCDFGSKYKVEATCTDPAGVAETCKVCGYTKVTAASADAKPLGHDEVVTTVKPTCYVAGLETTTCYRCGLVVAEKDLPATEHKMKAVANDIRVKAATCGTKGIAVYACELCGYEEVVATAYDKNNHEYETIKVYTAADCKTGTTGLVFEKCAKCGVQGVHTVAPAHTYVDTAVKKAPTCDVAGIMVQTCSVCEKATREVSIPKVAHVMITEEQAADCDLPAGIITRCANCDLVTSFLKTGSAKLGHKWSDKVWVKPTCTTAGGYQITCLREGCGKTEFTASTATADAALNHKGKTLVKEIAATCKSPAYKIYNCPICKTEITEIAGAVDAKNGHAWEVTAFYGYEPTCAKPGFVDRKCTLCGVTKSRVWHTPAHEMSDYVFTTDYVYRFCKGCGLIETIYVSENFTGFNGCSKITVDANGNKTMTGAHKGLVVKPGKEGTCEEAGQIEHIECTVCGTIIQQGAVIPAHNVTVIEAKAATCTEEGNTAGKYCETCKEYIVKPETIAKVAHTVVEVPAVDATATTAGTTAGKKCSVCGEILEGCEPVAKLGATVKRLCVVRSKAADYREDATSEVVKMLAEGTAVVITGELVNEYYPVEGGYIHMSYITVA